MKKLGRFLILEGIVSIGLAYLMYYIVALRSALEILYQPFEWIGLGLRWLSLLSPIGNLSALFFYGLLSLIPILYLLLYRWRNGLRKVDLLLLVISAFTFYMLYYFVNPGLMLKWAPRMMSDPSMIAMVKLAFVFLFISLCLSYFIFRMLEALTAEHTDNHLPLLGKRLQLILVILSVLYTFLIGYFATFDLFVTLHKYADQTDADPFLTPLPMAQGTASLDQFVVVLSYLLKCLPVILAVYILAAGVNLLKEMAAHHMEEEELQAATLLSSAGKRAVYVTVFSNLALNVIQFILSSQLSDTDFELNITLTPLIIALGAMILSGYFKETKELHEDNEMII